MNKQEVIKKAYLEIISEDEYNKINIDGEGFTYWFNTDFEVDSKLWDFCDNNEYIRPISLKGIESNNGWLSVKYHGLPNKDGFYWCINKKKTETIRYYFANEKEFDEGEMEILNQKSITHYQPIEKPQPPLY